MTLHTLAAPATHAVDVRRSRFLVSAVAVACEQAAAKWLRAVRDPDASHTCWAWRIGAAYRSSDDGEPAGTAGRPILAAIDTQGLDQVAVAVTRWYGGIKLGAGGLARAYGGTAAECLRLASRVPLIEMIEAAISFPFADTGAVHATLAQARVEKTGESFDAVSAAVRVRLPADALDDLKSALRDATRDRACIQHL